MTIDDAIAATDATIHSLRKAHSELVPYGHRYDESRQSLQQAQLQLAELKNRKAPISKLPMEILATIFKAGLDNDDDDDEFLHHTLPFSILVSHVVRRWRVTAINLPSLWTTIWMDITKRQPLSGIYLKRSGSYSLDLIVICDEDVLSTFDPSILHLHRNRSLYIQCSHYQPAFTILGNLHCSSAPYLQSLEVEVLWNGDVESLEWTQPLVHDGQILQGGAPTLTSITLQWISLKSCQPPLNALTKLVLQQCPSTIELTCDKF
jgi:hypothetical protein